MEVCLAADFFLKKGVLSLSIEGKDVPAEYSVDNAVLSKSGTYYFAAFSKDAIKSCKMENATAYEGYEKRNPEFYKVVNPKQDTTDSQEFCLATRFTVQNVTDETWPPKTNNSEAVRFEGEGYYSRLMPYDNKCTETGDTFTHSGDLEKFEDVYVKKVECSA
ncbi:hypothetical protein Baya_10420 [Bagarius yarrelli]|uniref:Uncharacterized protein n=1 Tax=Bagarius yarrelli TaxID=175774 RepID=A0A556UF54_BAGYA|nr:hypothetical protein Baya_10420 [Bagarius yarrelli]